MPEEIKSTSVTTSVDITSKIGWAQLLTKLADKYGLPTVLLCCLVGILFWHGNRTIEVIQTERKDLQKTLEAERTEDKQYYRGEFKTVVENSTKAVEASTKQSESIEKIVEKNTEALEENTFELREQRSRRQGTTSVGSN